MAEIAHHQTDNQQRNAAVDPGGNADNDHHHPVGPAYCSESSDDGTYDLQLEGERRQHDDGDHQGRSGGDTQDKRADDGISEIDLEQKARYRKKTTTKQSGNGPRQPDFPDNETAQHFIRANKNFPNFPEAERYGAGEDVENNDTQSRKTQKDKDRSGSQRKNHQRLLRRALLQGFTHFF